MYTCIYVNMDLCFDFVPLGVSLSAWDNSTADNAIIYCECFSYKFGFNIICRLEILKNPAMSQAEGGRMYSEKVSGKQKGVKGLNSS